MILPFPHRTNQFKQIKHRLIVFFFKNVNNKEREEPKQLEQPEQPKHLEQPKHGDDDKKANTIRAPPRSAKRNSSILVDLKKEDEAEPEADHNSFYPGLDLGKISCINNL